MGSEAINLDDKKIALNKQVEEAMAKSVSKLFSNMFLEKVEIGATVYGKCPSSDLSGITGLIQKDVHGILKIGFTEVVLFNLLEKIYNRKFDKIDNTILDGIGELSNNVFGQFKKQMNDLGFTFKMSIPTIVYGKDHSMYPFLDGPLLYIPVKSKYGELSLTLILNQYLY